MKNLILRRWGATEAANLLFCLTVFFLPLGTFYLLSPSRLTTDFEKTFVYATDILLALCTLFVFGRFTFVKKIEAGKTTRLWWASLGLIFLAAFISLIASPHDFQVHELTSLLRLLLLLLFLVAFQSSLRDSWKKRILITFVLSGMLQAAIALLQFVHQSSLGLSFIGEPRFTADTINVGKVLIDGARIIRPTGTFPHANVLGGFLVITLLATIQLFFDALKAPRRHLECSLLFAFSLIQLLALLLTFSRSAWLASSMIGLYVLWESVQWLMQSKEARKIMAFWLTSGAIALGILGYTLSPLLRTRISTDEQSGNIPIELRQDLTTRAYSTIHAHPIAGVGYSDLVIQLRKETPTLAAWQYQPVHSWILLITAEQGIVGLFAWVAAMTFGLLTLLRRIKKEGIAPIFSFSALATGILMLLGLFDHYLVDIQQGRVLFFVIGALYYAEFLSHPHPHEA